MTRETKSLSPEQKAKNLRLAVILALFAAIMFGSIIYKVTFYGFSF